MKQILLFLLLVVSVSLKAQNSAGRLTGQLVDSASNLTIGDATVSMLAARDSVLISFSQISADGRFTIENIRRGKYIAMISAPGFRTEKRRFEINEVRNSMDLGTIRMIPQYNILSDVTVKDEAPVKIKGDTIAYNADAFKTKPNAMVEDLLKKLPGVNVKRDGTIIAQGEQVQKVFVDGKQFFGDDPKMATKNLTADMVSEVEVYDDMSDQSKFNKIDDGSRSKAINLKLKKEKKRGMFGQSSAAYGTDDRYNGNARLNSFRGSTQISAFANANNINQKNFTVSDMPGGSPKSGGGKMLQNPFAPIGDITVFSGAVNYNDTWSKSFDANASYNMNRVDNRQLKTADRESYFGDSVVKRRQESDGSNMNSLQRATTRLVWTIDKDNSIIWSSVLGNQSFSGNKNETSRLYNSYPIADGQSSLQSAGKSNNMNENILWRKKFSKAGRTLSVALAAADSRVNTEALNNNKTVYYDKLGLQSKQVVYDQNIFRNTSLPSSSANISYTEPLDRKTILELNSAVSTLSNLSAAYSYNKNQQTGKYDVPDSILSNNFVNKQSSLRIGSNLRFIRAKSSLQLGGAVQQSRLVSDDKTHNSLLKRDVTNLLWNALYTYQILRSRTIKFDYRARTNAPSANQLQPLRNISNAPLYYEGNPDLKQEVIHTCAIAYKSYDPFAFANILASLNLTYYQDRIINGTTLLTDGSQLTKPLNASGVYNLAANFNYGKSLRGGIVNYNLTTTMAYNHDVGNTNGMKNKIRGVSFEQAAFVSLHYKEIFDFSVNGSVGVYKTAYSLQSGRNLSYMSQDYGADLTWFIKRGFYISSELDYTGYSHSSDGNNDHFMLLNASVSKQIGSRKKAELRLSVNDILNKNKSLQRNVQDNYTEQIRTEVIKRYAMLSFIYNLNIMGGKKPKSK